MTSYNNPNNKGITIQIINSKDSSNTQTKNILILELLSSMNNSTELTSNTISNNNKCHHNIKMLIINRKI